MNKTNFVLHIPRTWEGADRAWCGRDMTKISAWKTKVEFLNADADQSCKHCLIKYRNAPADRRESVVNWLRVEEIQKKSFHGRPLTDLEIKQCQLAIKADRVRYSNYAAQLREEYKQSLRGVR